MKHHDTKKYILRWISSKRQVRTADITRALGISRQTAIQHLQELIRQNKVDRLGSTVDARYVAHNPQARRATEALASICLQKNLKGLQEDSVFNQVDSVLRLKKRLSEPAYRICRYAFTEMLNNAIEHSHSKKARIRFQLLNGEAHFWIADAGVGAFESVRKFFKLNDHFEAVEHLMKGKQTTDSAHHSGQGIFFTSRAADCFVLQSSKIKWVVDHRIDDQFVEEIKKRIYGTQVHFQIKMKSRRDLKKIFDEFTNDHFEFDKTEVMVRLSKKQAEYVARSEARRILFGLDRFKRIVFDYEGVKGIGQGFADEVYHIFAGQHPDIDIQSVGFNSAVGFMIHRAQQT